MRVLEDLLPAGFLRVHRSQIVNLALVAAVEPLEQGRVQVRLADRDGTAIEVARRQTRALRQALGLR
ncbi:MAG: LytTR family DNA-binding domain-containing protein [Actinomycetota bacterium]